MRLPSTVRLKVSKSSHQRTAQARRGDDETLPQISVATASATFKTLAERIDGMYVFSSRRIGQEVEYKFNEIRKCSHL